MGLKSLPDADKLIEITDPQGVTLLVDDGSELVSLVCQNLVTAGHRVVVILLPGHHRFSLPDNVSELQLANSDEENIRQALSQISDPVSRFIYLYPDSGSKDLLKTAFFFAKYLKTRLTERAAFTRPAFITISRGDGAFGTNDLNFNEIFSGGLFGLVKSLNLEWPSVFCRAVDIARDLPHEKAAEKISNELTDPNISLVQTSYNGAGARFTLEAIPFVPNKKLGSARITNKSVFLVSGGGRGVTALCVKALAATFKSTFILLGRSELGAEEPIWARQVSDLGTLKIKAIEAVKAAGEKPLPRQIDRLVNEVLAQREIKETLAYLHEQGSEVYYRTADVTNPVDLKNVLDKLITIIGPVTGLIHGAGRLADKRIENKTEADFDSVFDVKIIGLESLMQVLSPDHLQHIALFSSVAGFYGNVGQTDYAMANEVLNRYAYWFRKKYPVAHVVSINWGAWDSGMVSPELKKMLQDHGVSFVPSEEGPKAFLDQFSLPLEDQVQVILGGTLPMAIAPTNGASQTYTIQRRLKVELNPFLQDHIILGNPVLPISVASAWLAQAATQLYPGFHLFKAEKIKLFKGLVFDGNEAELYQIKVQELIKSPDQIEVQVTISSEKLPGKTTLHYQGNLFLQKIQPEPPVHPLPGPSLIPTIPDGSILYRNRTLFHGPDFHGVKKVISIDPKGALLLCGHDGISPERQGQFAVAGVNGFLTDMMYQGLLVWVREFKGCACLPMRTEQVEMYEGLSFGKPFYVSVEVVKSTDFVMEADLTAFDCETGKVLMKSHRASVTLMKDLKWS